MSIRPAYPTPPDRTFHRKKVILPWLCTPEHSMLSNLTFIECFIYGPAVLIAEAECKIDGGWAQGEFDGAAWITPKPLKHRGLIQGAIPVRNCTFVKCWFYGVGFAATADRMKELAADVGWLFQDSPHLRPPPGSPKTE